MLSFFCRLKMCKIQMLRALVTERLTVAVEEIFVVLERTVAEYEDELSRTRADNARQRQLPEAVIEHQAESRKDFSEEVLPPEQRDWRFTVEQNEPQLPCIKEEVEELQPPRVDDEGTDNIRLEENQLEELEEADVSKFTALRMTKTLKDVSEEVLPQQDWRFTVEQNEPQLPCIKEECTDNIRQEENQLEELEEADMSKFPALRMTKTLKGDDDQGQSSQLAYSQMEMKELEIPSSSSSHYTTTEADCGGSEAGSLLTSQSDSDDTTSTSSDTDAGGRQAAVTYCTDRNDFRCTQCGKLFGKKLNLTNHMKRHTMNKHFQCSHCAKLFVAKNDLKVHMRIHTGEKPYSCSVCGNRFSQKGTLTTHMRRHTGEKPFLCLFCGRRFPRKYTLMKHITLHTS
ncbi:zinc finger protein 287-like isoform X2 [Entelurus aequoreus]|uniref:zinc finger protein 287-like isoform X2 n=1 Tax=Entelurus aequoreus TaxID=161455 RepID=UPI002B1E7762|nr:zinc finger protein 287-like isoform X2 [Entelurus aequoreus]